MNFNRTALFNHHHRLHRFKSRLMANVSDDPIRLTDDCQRHLSLHCSSFFQHLLHVLPQIDWIRNRWILTAFNARRLFISSRTSTIDGAERIINYSCSIILYNLSQISVNISDHEECGGRVKTKRSPWGDCLLFFIERNFRWKNIPPRGSEQIRWMFADAGDYVFGENSYTFSRLALISLIPKLPSSI